MHAYFYLTLAIIAEVAATLTLPLTQEFSKPLPTLLVLAGYTLSFYFMTLSLSAIPIGIAYSIWSGVGIILINTFAFYWSDMRLRWLENLYLMLTVGDKNICKPEVYSQALNNAGFSNIKAREVSKNVLPKSSQVLSQEPYLQKLKDCHHKHFGDVATGLLPLFLISGTAV